jgi:3-hydroxyisobutyrate dehydrogenase-like beta-hydroxyacid dehydrogenase
VTGAGAVLTSLPDGAAVRAVWTGPGGVLDAADAGTFVVELSTIDPVTMRDVAGAAVRAGLRPLDCPVSGGPVEAGHGTLALIVGGDDADVEDAAPLLAQLGTVSRTGPAGTAKVVKLCNNLMTMGNIAVAAEAFALGEAAGVEPGALFEVLSHSGGRSHHFLKRFPNALAGDWAPGFTVALGEKDLRLAIELGRSVSLPTPTAESARSRYRRAIDAGMGSEDIVSLLRLYRDGLAEGAGPGDG